MDINLARTFLEVVNARSFIRASERLSVTQTTVTTRIRSLEEQLGATLFIRNRSGARLTVEGERFAPYATSLVQTWSRAQSDLGSPQNEQLHLRLGGETSLWNPLLLNWLLWIREHEPDLAFDARVDTTDPLLNDLEHGLLDAIIVHRPLYNSTLVAEQILEGKLVHVQVPGKPFPDIAVQWGEAALDQFSVGMLCGGRKAFGFNLGQLALQTMLKGGGNGWFRTKVVEQYLQAGELERVRDSPEFTYPLFVNYRVNHDCSGIEAVLTGLREVVADNPVWVV